jgi:hypothetical protein
MASRSRTASARTRRKPTNTADATALDLANVPGVRELVGDSFLDTFVSMMQTIEWAEEEIEFASREHPEQADPIWHSFPLLQTTHELLEQERTYRSHCREILARVAAGEDTRPGTAAECCVACCEMSQLAPLRTAGAGLYVRMWRRAGFPEIDGAGSEHYEALQGPEIDDLERTLRRRLKQDWRRLPRQIEHSRLCPASQAPGAQLTLDAADLAL